MKEFDIVVIGGVGGLNVAIGSAMQEGIKAQSISKMIHIYPTIAQANKQVVNKFMGEKYLTPFSKKLAKFFFKLK